MAIDEWLLDQHQAGKHPPTLRFYTWNPAAISLGYHQQKWPVFWQDLTWQGKPLELVKRPSGGRAVLHQGDLTYAVIASDIAGSRAASYRKICEFLIAGWRELGIELSYGEAGRGYIHNPNCFGTATGADLITSEGNKLIGSAQLRRGNAILQHGSMRLEPNIELFKQVFGEPIQPIQLPLFHPGDTLFAPIIQALTNSARQCFGIEFITQPLSESEWQIILSKTTS